MLGAIVGDIAGSVYEWGNVKTTEFQLFSKACTFTDDSVMTIAVAHAMLDAFDVERMGGRELCERAEELGVDLRRFAIDKEDSF